MEFLKDMNVFEMAVALVPLVNIMVEVTKKLVNFKKPESIVVIWSVLLAVSGLLLALAQTGETSPALYALEAAKGVLIGGVVAYAAMFGYDELYDKAAGAVGSLVAYLTGRTADAREGDEPHAE